MIGFKGKHDPKNVILYAVSNHEREDIMAEQGDDVDHATLNSCAIVYGPLRDEETLMIRKSKANNTAA